MDARIVYLKENLRKLINASAGQITHWTLIFITLFPHFFVILVIQIG